MTAGDSPQPGDSSSPVVASSIEDRPIVDRDGALKRMGGDVQLFQDMVQFFIEDAPGLLTEMDTANASGDAENVARAAHSLKGLAANFGATDAIEAAQTLEKQVKASGLAETDAAFANLHREMQRLLTALEAHRRA